MRFRKGCRLWWLLLPVIALDRVTKRAAAAALAPGGVKTALPGLLSWAYTENRGAAFSLFSGRSLLLILLTLALIAGLLIYLLRHEDNPAPERAGLWLVAGGGLGNLWDRLVYGCVIDFIRLDFVNFAVFNVADVFVCAGALLVALSALKSEAGRKRHG